MRAGFFLPVESAGGLHGRTRGVWFGVSFILYFIFHTVYVLPYYALGPELTLNYNDRSSLFACASRSPFWNDRRRGAPGVLMKALHLNERQVFFGLGIFFGVVLTVLYWLLVVTIKERPDFVARESNPLVPGVRRALRNRPFAILLAAMSSAASPARFRPR